MAHFTLHNKMYCIRLVLIDNVSVDWSIDAGLDAWFMLMCCVVDLNQCVHHSLHVRIVSSHFLRFVYQHSREWGFFEVRWRVDTKKEQTSMKKKNYQKNLFDETKVTVWVRERIDYWRACMWLWYITLIWWIVWYISEVMSSNQDNIRYDECRWTVSVSDDWLTDDRRQTVTVQSSDCVSLCVCVSQSQ